MYWGPGRWLSSLRYHVRRNVDQWRANNATIQELRYNRLHALVILGSRHLIFAQAILFGLGPLVSMLIALAQPSVSAKWTFWLVKTDPSTLLATVWTVQVTLAAVVYPIVIGFITLMFQQRPSSTLRMMIFLDDSGAKLSGLSSLILCLVAAGHWLLCWAVREEVLLGWVLFDTVWLAINTVASIFFLYRTFEFLQTEKAERIVQRYAVDVMWRLEVQETLMTHFLMAASRVGLLPKPKLDDEMAMLRGQPTVLVTPMMSQSGEPCITVESKRPQEVRNVLLRPLGWAIKRWLDRAEAVDRPASGLQRGPSLYFSAFPGQSYPESVDLCRVDGAVLPTPFERRLIRMSYRLGRFRLRTKVPPISDLLEELSRDVLNEIEKRQMLRAKDRLDAMLDLHAAVLRSGEFRAADAKDNYALLSVRRLISVPVHDGWARHYFPIFEAAAAAVPDNPGIFNSVAYLPAHLFAETRLLRNAAIGDRMISLGRIELLKLGVWWTRIVEQQSNQPLGPCAPALLDARNRRSYEEVMRAFVGAWESMGKHYFDYGSRRKRAPWPDLQLTSHFQMTHLGETVLMFFDAISRGDQQMAKAISDSLEHWTPSLELNAHVDRFLVRTPHLLTMTLMEGDEAALQTDVELPEFSPLKRDLVQSVMAVVFDNLWTDYMLIAAYCLAQWGKECPLENSLPAQFIIHFLRQRSDSNQVGDMTSGPLGVAVVFWGLARQKFGDQAYRAQIDSLVEKIQGVRGPEMVPGRIYTHWGTSDLDSLLDAQLIVLCLLISTGWRAERGHDREILKLLRAELNRGSILDRWLEQLLARLKDPSFKAWAAFYDCVAGKVSQTLTFDAAVSAVMESLSSFKDAVKAVHINEIQQSPIDPAELDRVAGWASEKAFAAATAAIPVSLFAAIRQSKENLPERHVTLNGMDRGEFTIPKRSIRPSGEDDVISGSVRDVVGAFVMNEVIVQATPLVETRNAQNPDAYWRELQLAAATLTKKGLTPVLLVENPMTPRWVFDWGLDWSSGRVERPKALRVVRKQDVAISEYLAHFNEIEVYRAQGLPPGASYVFAREAFYGIDFSDLGTYRFVKVDAIPKADAPTLIDLRITWGQRVELAAHPVVKLQYGEAASQ